MTQPFRSPIHAPGSCIQSRLMMQNEDKEAISFQEEDSKDALTDGDPDTFWETDGRQGKHWIKLSMRAGTIIRLVCQS